MIAIVRLLLLLIETSLGRRKAIGVARGTGDGLLVVSTDLGMGVALRLLTGRHVALVGEKGHLDASLGQNGLDVL